MSPMKGTPRSWPVFRGDVNHSGAAAVKGPRSPRLAWVFRTRGRVYADVAVAGRGTVYVASHDHRLYAVSHEGTEKWRFDAGGKIWGSPAIGPDGTVYVGSDADTLFALNSDGTVKWSLTTTLPPAPGKKDHDGKWDIDTSFVLGKDGTVYFGCHYYLYAVEPSGRVAWRFQAGLDRVKIFSSPALAADGTIYFGTQGKRFFAVDGRSEVLWNLETEGDNDSSPAVADDGTVYFGSDDGRVRAVAPGGALRWERDLSGPVRAPVSISPKGVILASTYGREPFIAALDRETGEERWRFHIEPGEGAFYGIQSGAAVDEDGYVYFGARDHHVYSLTPRGKLAWRFETGDQVDGGAVLGPDGTLYIGSDDKRVYAFAPDAGKVQSAQTLPTQ